MITLALLPIVLSVLFALAGPRVSRLLSGRTATLLLTVVALIGALSVGLVLSAIGCLAIAQWAPVAAAGHWSPASVAARDPLPYWLVASCAVLAAGLMLASAVCAVGCVRRLARSVALCRRLDGEHAGGLVVLDRGRPDAFALPGLPGRTVVTRSMLRALSGAERRALLAHERSHVVGYHFAYVSLARLAATANPVLGPLVASVRLAVERWADEDAARAVGDRNLVATALARAGLVRGGGPVPRGALGVAVSDLQVRLDSLMAPRRSALRTGAGVTAMLVLAGCCAVSSGALGLHLHNLIEWAQAVGVHRRS